MFHNISKEILIHKEETKMGYSIALIEKPMDDGLSKGEIVNLAFIIDGDEFIPIQFEALKT